MPTVICEGRGGEEEHDDCVVTERPHTASPRTGKNVLSKRSQSPPADPDLAVCSQDVVVAAPAERDAQRTGCRRCRPAQARLPRRGVLLQAACSNCVVALQIARRPWWRIFTKPAGSTDRDCLLISVRVHLYSGMLIARGLEPLSRKGFHSSNPPSLAIVPTAKSTLSMPLALAIVCCTQ